MARRSLRRSHTRTYKAWDQAKRRCFDQRNPGYRYYGGRGIAMCDRWRDSFEAFLADMGECPPGLTLERNDNDGPYALDNCRWATKKEQTRNRRTTRRVMMGDRSVSVAEAAELTGLGPATIYARLKAGWTDAEAINPTLRINQYDR